MSSSPGNEASKPRIGRNILTVASVFLYYLNSHFACQELNRLAFTRVSTVYNILPHTTQIPKLKDLIDSDDETPINQ